MKRSLLLTQDALDEVAYLRSRELSSTMGAVVHFTGWVRDLEGGEPIAGLEYEAFPAMVERQFTIIFDAIQSRWPVASVRVVHRLGKVSVNDVSLWVEVVAPHRGEAFAACQYLIDEMKRLVPIWKRPLFRPS